MGNRWFRWYEGTTEDGKFRTVARESRVTIRDVTALWALLLEDASKLEHRGVCIRDKHFIKAVLEFKDGVVENILVAMESIGLIHLAENAITVCNWNKRQFEGDIDKTAAERQKRKRERDNPSSHDPVTHKSRVTHGPQIQIPDTDRDPPIVPPKPARSPAEAGGYSDDFEQFWNAYPKKIGKGAAFTAWKKNGHPPVVKLIGVLDSAKRSPKWKEQNGRFIPNPATWLNQKRWDDEYSSKTSMPDKPEYQG